MRKNYFEKTNGYNKLINFLSSIGLKSEEIAAEFYGKFEIFGAVINE